MTGQKRRLLSCCVLLFGLFLCGCSSFDGNAGRMTLYAVPGDEPQWIRNGEPVEFEEKLWYPKDSIDVLLDTEVLPIFEYNGAQIFVSKMDVKPYNQLYTKFGRNKFRLFTRLRSDD